MPLKFPTAALPGKTSTTLSTAEVAVSNGGTASPDWQSLLSDKSFNIEFHGYLSNHVKHAVIALHRLDASAERVTEYWNTYTALTPYSLELDPISWGEGDQTVKACTAEDFKAWRGKKVHWQEQVLFLQKELETTFGGNVDELLQNYAPDLLPGMAGALTHGIIHLGWAVDAQNTWMTLEGLAYLNFAYVAMPEGSLTEEGEDRKEEDNPMASIIRVAREIQEKNLAETWIQAAKDRYNEHSGFHAELIPSGFQWQLAKVLAHPHHVATTLPSWLDRMDLPTLLEEVYRLATLLYLTTLDAQDGHGNFLVLHLLTSLWGAEKVCTMIGKESVTRTALKHYYAVSISLLAASAGGFPSAEALKSTMTAFPRDKVEDSQDETTLWKEIVDKAYLEEEEHNIKLVYVMRELWRRYGMWSGFRKAGDSFTVTPNIGPSQVSYKA